MTRISFAYTTSVTNSDGKEVKDESMMSFEANFPLDMKNDKDFRRMCYVSALDEITVDYSERFGETFYDDVDSISISMTRMDINKD